MYSSSTRYIVFQKINTEEYYAVKTADFIQIEKFYSLMDNFLYAPDNLTLTCIPITFNRINGMIDFEEEEIAINVHKLKRTSTTIAD